METNLVKNHEIEIDLKEIFFILLGKAGIIILSGMILALLAIIGTKLFITPQYQSTTKMYVLSQSGSTLTTSDISISTYLTRDCPEIIKSRTVMENVIAELDLNMSYAKLNSKVSVETSSDTRIVKIVVEDADPYVARDIANAIRDAAAVQITSIMNLEAVNVVDEANVPQAPASPSTMKNGFIAGVLGCFMAVAVILIKHFMNDTIRVSEDVEKYLGVSVLGTIPLDEHLVNLKKKNNNNKKASRGGKRK